MPDCAAGWTLADKGLTCFMFQTSHQPPPSLHERILPWKDTRDFLLVCLQCLEACLSAQSFAMSGRSWLFNGRILPVSFCGMRMNFNDMLKVKKKKRKKCFFFLLWFSC